MRIAIVVALTLTACSDGGTAPPTANVLPLKPGYYNQGESCSDVSNASIVLLGRTSINWSRSVCELTAIEKISATRWKAMQSCKNIQSETAEAPYRVLFEIQNETTFALRYEGSKESAHYRYCAQSSMPEPWRSNDISDRIN
jgi:hypothetical protein